MAFYQFIRKQELNCNSDMVWEFISNPENLKRITPPNLGFKILTNAISEKMYAGMIISYHVTPMFGIKTLWVTEITHVSEGKYFVDEQRIGPYKIWHHQHLIEQVGAKTIMTDIVSYQPPFGFIGSIFNWLIIRPKLDSIFNFRERVLEKIFGKV
jgi:ligand-binding SRPBCC domain-containing protein